MIDPRSITLKDVERLPVFGGLTTEEDRLIGQYLQDAPDMGQSQAELADTIATAEGISRVEAKAVVDAYAAGGEMEDKVREIGKRHEAAIKAHQKLARDYGYVLMDATVTAMLRSRGGEDGMGLAEWDEKATGRLMRNVYLAVWTKAQAEVEAENQPPAEVTEESLGKRSTAPTAARTGRRSSGS